MKTAMVVSMAMSSGRPTAAGVEVPWVMEERVAVERELRAECSFAE